MVCTSSNNMLLIRFILSQMLWQPDIHTDTQTGRPKLWSKAKCLFKSIITMIYSWSLVTVIFTVIVKEDNIYHRSQYSVLASALLLAISLPEGRTVSCENQSVLSWMLHMRDPWYNASYTSHCPSLCNFSLLDLDDRASYGCEVLCWFSVKHHTIL